MQLQQDNFLFIEDNTFPQALITELYVTTFGGGPLLTSDCSDFNDSRNAVESLESIHIV